MGSFKDLEARITRLKSAEEALTRLDPPADRFAEKITSIRCKLRSPSQVDAVERELDELWKEVDAYREYMNAVSLMKAKAASALEAASESVSDVRSFGSVVELEKLLANARKALESGEHDLAIEQAQQVDQLAAKLKAEARPRIVVMLEAETCTSGEWKTAELRVANKGNAHARSVGFRFSSEVEVKWVEGIPRLDAGEGQTLAIGLKPLRTGDILVDVTATCADMNGTEYSDVQALWLKVADGSSSGAWDASSTAALVGGRIQNYEVGRKVGSGGFADVYLGCGPDGKTIALKIPRLSICETIDMGAFNAEAEVWSKLSRFGHQHIVPVLGYGTSPCPWIAMEYMSGGSLRERMAEVRPETALQLAVKVADALHFAHHHGVMHRDIKPENVLFDDSDTPKLTDWGLAKVLLDLSQPSADFRGTLARAAPEQVDSRKFGPVDWRTDIYQMGVLLYELLTHQLPFAGGDPGTVVSAILNEVPKTPTELNPTIPQALGEAIVCAMAKRKEERFQTMAAFADEIRAAIDSA